MMKRLAKFLLVGSLLAAACSTASAQGKGNVICPTAAPGTSDNRCASTAFVQSAIPLVGITGLTGDVTATGAGYVGATLATVNANVGTFGSTTACITATANGKGLITGISAATCTPAFSSVTGTASLAQGGLGGSQAGATAGQVPVYPGSGGGAVPTNPSVFTGFYDPLNYGMACNGSTDDTAAFNALLAIVNTAGGGEIRLPSICLIAGAVVFPNSSIGGVVGYQSSIRITGSATNLEYNAVAGPSGLDLRYNASVAKLDTRGIGTIEIDHLSLIDGGSDCAPFIQTTNTVIIIHDNLFSGTGINRAACNDGVILGGSTITSDNASTAPFQGYASKVYGNTFTKMRKIAVFNNYANAIWVQNNTLDNQSGSNESTPITAANNAVAASFTVPGASATISAASIATNVLTVTGVTGTLVPSQYVNGSGITPDTYFITGYLTGSGGAGTYSLNGAPGSIGSESMTAKTGHQFGAAGNTLLINISGATGNWTPINTDSAYTNGVLATIVDPYTLTIPVNSTGFGALTGSPVIWTGSVLEFNSTMGSSSNTAGNFIINNLIEIDQGYMTFAKMNGGSQNTFTGNALYDSQVGAAVWTTLAYGGFDTYITGFSGLKQNIIGAKIKTEAIIDNGAVPINVQLAGANLVGSSLQPVVINSQAVPGFLIYSNTNLGSNAVNTFMKIYGNLTIPVDATNAGAFSIANGSTLVSNGGAQFGVNGVSTTGAFDATIFKNSVSGPIYFDSVADGQFVFRDNNSYTNVLDYANTVAATWTFSKNVATTTVFLNKSAVPILSTCGTGSPVAATGSGNQGGQFTVGGGTITTCTVTFANAYPNYAFCTISPANAGASAVTVLPYISASSKTAFTVTMAASTPGAAFNYSCQGQ